MRLAKYLTALVFARIAVGRSFGFQIIFDYY